MILLGSENYKKGFLMDDEWMAGISETLENQFISYVLSYTTGEYLLYQTHPELSSALEILNAIPREWKFETFGGCGGAACSSGSCDPSQCKIAGGGCCPTE